MNTEPKTLTEAFPAYPADHPQSLADLVAADPDTISDSLAWFLRKQTVAATRASERHHVRGPEDVLRLLANGYALHAWEGAWVTYGLTADRQVALVTGESGRTKSVRKATRLIPKAADLPDLPHGGHAGKRPAYLVLFGGTPEVLEKDHVAQGLATLQRVAPVADVCFYHRDPDAGIPPTLWSVRAGVGVTSAGHRVDFPNLQKLEEVKP